MADVRLKGSGNLPGSTLWGTNRIPEGGGGGVGFGTGSKVISSTARPSTFHSRQLAANPPGKRSQTRKIQEDVLREAEEKRSRLRLGYDD